MSKGYWQSGKYVEESIDDGETLELDAGAHDVQAMTIWDYYAAAGLQGVLASDHNERLSPEMAADMAADMADAMLEERKKRMAKARGES